MLKFRRSLDCLVSKVTRHPCYACEGVSSDVTNHGAHDVPSRRYTSFPGVTHTKVSSHTWLYRISPAKSRGKFPRRARSMVLLFPSLFSKEDAVLDVCNLYHKHDLDVIIMRTRLVYFLRPSLAAKEIKKTLDYLYTVQVPLNMETLVTHTTSLGVFLYAAMLWELSSDGEKYGAISRRLRGHIWDSPVSQSVSNMATAAACTLREPGSRSTNNRRTMEPMVRLTCSAYFYLARFLPTPYYSTELLDRMIIDNLNHAPPCPVLIYTSFDDPLFTESELTELISKLEGRGIPVRITCWEQSWHGRHALQHPDQYVKALQGFLAFTQDTRDTDGSLLQRI